MARGTFAAAVVKMTVRELLEKYLKEESPKKRSGARDKFKTAPLIEALGAYFIHALTPGHLVEYRERRVALRAPQTVVHELALLHRAYVIGVQEWGIVLPNGIPKVRRPKLPSGRERRITDDELTLIACHTDSPLMVQLMEFAVETAMRRGEILTLDWADVDLGRCTIFLRRTKTDSPRTVPLSSRALAVLQGIPEADRAGSVFPIKPASLSRAFNRAVKRAGLTYVRFHDMRHEGTSRLFEKGFNVMEVATITGHKTLAMLRRYTHLEAAKFVDRLG
jgi:integrase